MCVLTCACVQGGAVLGLQACGLSHEKCHTFVQTLSLFLQAYGHTDPALAVALARQALDLCPHASPEACNVMAMCGSSNLQEALQWFK